MRTALFFLVDSHKDISQALSNKKIVFCESHNTLKYIKNGTCVHKVNMNMHIYKTV